jgi:hypothetical protein
MHNGDDQARSAIHRRSLATIRRRRIYLALAVIALVVILLVVPEHATPTAASAGGSTATTNVPSGITPAPANYASGTTVGGVACAAGVRQVTWSAYAPPCKPAWHGNNGGATTRGVTGSTIYLSYRAASTSQLAELYGLIPPTVIGTNQEEEATLNAYINAFNKTYELYGRKVVLVPFDGKGDFINEDLGEDQTQAQEDAVTVATSLHAFADMSLVDASAVYATDLAAQHVVTTSLYENAESWYQQYAPWEYSPGPNCTKMAQATAAVLGKQLAGLPASHAGGALRTKTRTFGMIYLENPEAAQCAAEDTSELAKYGQHLVRSVGVKFDLTQLIATAASAVAQMKAAGVTTVILSSADPITPRFFFQAADEDNYHPEWWFQSYFSGGVTGTDAYVRLWAPDQIGQILGFGAPTQPFASQEAVTAFRVGNTVPGAKPVPSYFWTYQSVVQFFDALQLAGPDLTPQSFHTAMSQITQSDPWGMYGGWNGSDGPYDAASQYHVVSFDPSATSPQDGVAGTFVACDGNKLFSYADSSSVPSHTQLSCSAASSKMTPPASALQVGGKG